MDKEAVGAGPPVDCASPSSAPPPAPPRLTPNPTLLQDAPPPTPVTASPPPPLTPAPKMAVARTASPHVPAPPKLSSAASPALHTYARPILPCASSAALTNGSARSVSAPASGTITPFHTPASPPGRQVAQPHPTNPSPPACVARQTASQQALLLGKVLKGAGQEQVLLRAQMLQNAPSPVGALAGGPPSLRPKPPVPVPPRPCRPQTALFPPLRPRPRAEVRAAPVRHLPVPPPTLYSPVRALPLRPKLQSSSPRVPAPLRPRAAAPPPETAPSASAQLQIIALASARPPLGPEAPVLPRRPASPPAAESRAPSEAVKDRVARNEQKRETDGTEADQLRGLLPTVATEEGRPDLPDREGDEDEAPSGGGDAPARAPSGGGDAPAPASSTLPKEPLPELDPVPTPELCHIEPAPEAPERKKSREEETLDDDHDRAAAPSGDRSASSSLSSPPVSPSAALNLSRRRPAAEEDERRASGSWEAGAWPEGRDVLTHLVEGFVIQEGLAPFPVNRSSLLLPQPSSPPPPPQTVNGNNGEAGETTAAAELSEHSADSQDDDKDPRRQADRGSRRDRGVLHCQFCGKRGHAHNFMRSKRFCSTSCARGFNVRLTKRLRALSAGAVRAEKPRPVLNRARSVPGKPLLLRLPRDLWSAGRRENDEKAAAAATAEPEEEDEVMEAAGVEEEEDDDEPAITESPVTAATPTSTVQTEPSQWTVEQVTAFIQALPGCGGGEVSSSFRLQEIDGQALLLLTEEHLMSSMNIKLGPALKICAHINALKHP
ncbi:polyhomeotic-like protein 3 isoform X2 [Corythoichthys intestinalis]|uniref:polyhomeotic-like protein 3 isoform X2 n=1 Tax=Corythoichthys intestinalis TaxID=161448 RepID=UPI0025A62400|nr:polyhomeotic-like protein 3 isoform X2 [Corythoichthys intestinalis]